MGKATNMILDDATVAEWAMGENEDIGNGSIARSHFAANQEIAELRDLLRRVMEAPCDTSDGEYGPRPVREAMGPGFKGWSKHGDANAALLAEVEAAVEGGR